MGFCDNHGLLDVSNACIRASWTAFLPATFVFLLCFGLLPVPHPFRRLFKVMKTPFKPFLTLQEAEAINSNPMEQVILGDDMAQKTLQPAPIRRTVIFAFIGMVETLYWAADGAYRLYHPSDEISTSVYSFLLATSWLYTVVRSIIRPTITSPYGTFTLYLLFFSAAVLQFGGAVYDHNVLGLPLPSTLSLVGMTGNLVAVLVLLGIVMTMPLATPSAKIDPKEIGNSVSPEDYATLWQWISFSWLYPLIRRGRDTTLHEKDVWNLSPTMQSRPLFTRFNAVYRSTLLRRIWATNSLDLIMDFLFTILSIAFNYAGPFFLKRILDAIDQESPTAQSQANAYIYAFLAFGSALLKAQADALHLWHARRGSTRIRTELMAAIYDKALKRRDFSGIIDKTNSSKDEPKAPGAAPKGKMKTKNSKGKPDDPRAGADIGKIVNLMSSDTNRITNTLTGISLMYGAPFEIAFSGVFLYQLLGLSAFAGFLVLVVSWPLNNFLRRRTVTINKGLMAATDKRVSVLNELIGAIKFIKFFAWEEKWISRVLDARETEINWIIKIRINQILFSLVATCAPILLSVVSFSVYIMNGNELTISTAFTAIALFGMVRAPLRVIPTWLVRISQAGVSIDRIAVYLDEDEVTDQVSILKRGAEGYSPSSAEDEGLGLENANLKWNEITQKVTPDDKKTGTSSPDPTDAALITRVDLSDSASERTVGESGERRAFELKDLSVKFPAGKLTVITGPTASGKSALLMAVLGEMTLLSGRIILSKEPLRVDENGLMHCISYAAQLPWLRHQSIKENILFGYPYDEARYNLVLECCVLRPDLEMLEDGDATEIGAKGINLSGGQKARVALARAVYARTKYVLLDDPLSAVDSHTSRFLYERLLCGPLLENRTVVLVTHHVELVLPGAYYLIRMLDGRIDTQGIVEDLRAQGFLEEIKHDQTTQNREKDKLEAEVEAVEKPLEDPSNPTERVKTPRKLIKEEHRETGGVKWSIYKGYLKASSYWIWGVLAGVVIINQFLGLAEKLWIRTWGDAYRNETFASFHHFPSPVNLNGGEVRMNGHFLVQLSEQSSIYHNFPGSPTISGVLGIIWPNASQHPYFYVAIYAAIGLTGAMVNTLSTVAQYTGALRASRILFKRLLESVVRATFRFHDTTPQGRILNRFGKDIDTIDSSLAGSLQSVNTAFAGFLVSIITVAVIFPYFVIPAFFVLIAYRELAIGYLNTGRDLRRMESTTRSPIYSQFGELLEGIVTIRAFSVERRFLDGLHTKIDITTKMWYTFWMTNRWLLLNFDSLGAFIILLAMVFSISTLKNDAGLAAVCITSAMAFSNAVYWTCRYWTSLELDLNAVERVIEYLDIPQEPPAVIESNRVPAYWPSSSINETLLVVENLQVKYAPELPPVLNDISFTLKAGERVGLLGRTGSGKSTLTMSIMRFVDPTNGKIIIDGIDSSSIGVQDLRSRLTFIPQDATLFSGTLRDNLDPFGEHSDAECLEVLYRVHMVTDGQTTASVDHSASPSSSSNPSGPTSVPTLGSADKGDSLSTTTATTTADVKAALSLDTQVSAGGTNFSQGQRQLIAMARALLRRSSIVILDEATSSIDFATDAKIQTTIREEFNNSLLLTVAHRLRTVIDYDRLIVLDNGNIAEFDTPWNLINKENGIFRNMCLKSGTFDELEAAAKEGASRD